MVKTEQFLYYVCIPQVMSVISISKYTNSFVIVIFNNDTKQNIL